MDALDIIAFLRSRLGAEAQRELFSSICSEERVQQLVLNRGTKLHPESFSQYLERTHYGMMHAFLKYGVEVLPMHFHVVRGLLLSNGSVEYDFIGYHYTEDAYAVSTFHLATQCSFYNTPSVLFSGSRFPEGFGVNAEDFTALQAIEECYHRYQIRVMGYTPPPLGTYENREHPMELEIKHLFERAIRNLGMSLTPLSETQRIAP